MKNHPNFNPGVNFYDEFVENTEEIELHQLINIGSCGLHIMFDSFKIGIEVTDWNIKTTAVGAIQILHDSPAREAGCISVSRSNILLLFFCATRWVKDRKVAERLVKIWPHISKIVVFDRKLYEWTH